MDEETILYNWLQEQKKEYKKGNLSKEQIDKLESLKGWTWN